MGCYLIACSTIDGHTLEICRHLQGRLESAGHAVTLLPVAQAAQADLAAHDVVVVGASIRYGKHRPDVLAFANERLAALQGTPTAFFSVNVVARKPQKNRAETNPYVRKFLARVRWQPTLVDVFAGKIDYPRYRALDRLVIRFIMWVTHGPTDPSAVIEFTDWDRVDAFAQRLAALPAQP